MAISITKNIGAHNPVRNQMRIGATGTALFNGAEPVYPSVTITFDGTNMPLDGGTIEFDASILGGAVDFTFRTTPGYEALELPAYSGGGVLAYATALATYMNTLPTLNTHYTATAVTVGLNQALVLTARVADDERYNIGADPDPWGALSVGLLTFTPFAQPVNGGVRFQLWATTDSSQYAAPNAEQFSLQLEEVYPAGKDGAAYFAVEDILRNLLAPTIPPPSTTASLNAVASYCPFVVKAAEQYGTPVQLYPSVSTAVKWAYLAGRDEAKRVEFPDWDDEIMVGGSSIRFLSVWPNTSKYHAKAVLPNQQEYLAWNYGNVYSHIKVRVDLQYETGLPINAHVLETLLAKQHQLLITPVSVSALGLAAIDPTRRLRAYRIYLTTSGTTVISDSRWYEVEYKTHLYARQLMYWTSAGGVDTIVLHGPRKTTAMPEVERSGRVVTDPATTHAARDTVAYLNSIKHERQAGTTYLTQTELPALAELTASEQVVELVNGEWWPVQQVKDEMDTTEDGRGLLARLVSYRYAFRDRAQSMRS